MPPPRLVTIITRVLAEIKFKEAGVAERAVLQVRRVSNASADEEIYSARTRPVVLRQSKPLYQHPLIS